MLWRMYNSLDKHWGVIEIGAGISLLLIILTR